ncbi:hypothetical protein H4582DRAFT_1511386 [Lactarius indigo]|nr:hypothetical protein H4582DRAFT_1511386 [Lactarius indigo]
MVGYRRTACSFGLVTRQGSKIGPLCLAPILPVSDRLYGKPRAQHQTLLYLFFLYIFLANARLGCFGHNSEGYTLIEYCYSSRGPNILTRLNPNSKSRVPRNSRCTEPRQHSPAAMSFRGFLVSGLLLHPCIRETSLARAMNTTRLRVGTT